MTTINQESWNDQNDQLRNDALRHERDEDMRDDDMTVDSRISDSRLPKHEYNLDDDEDDQNLSDDSIKGRDLDTDGGDEWDEGNVSTTDLDEEDLEDNDEAMAELHEVKNDKFGSLASSVQNGPDPDEIPEEHQADENELDYPDDDELEKGTDNEVNYTEGTEVEAPDETEAPEKAATLGDVDSTFTDQSHGRTSGRLIDHEPGSGSSGGEHGAYNL
ncbi:hypothetical protein BDD43_5802 [Mucilaginibacter gracilis]|uniref:Uncharacterized protein n=1 Tax=Mucilaginibacter gracilis TaxID=423350 RepID=A0A495JA03_9SPHI|nr:hypothetical protein [Mucilaginibacter gracilis]RKR85531.1 hypothetical protein BDD43_5802 [Mucilaginibacter gracilis]